MSKSKLVLAVLEDLKSLAMNLEKLANAIPADEVVEEVTSPEEAKKVSLEVVRAVLAAKSQSGKQPQVKALITKYGAKKLTDIEPVKYPELLKEAEAL